MDYTKFLGKKEHVVLAYLGGAHVFAKERRLRVTEPRPDIGFHSFEVSGRNARSLERVESPDPEVFAGCAKARGHFVSGWLVHQGGVDRLALLPEEEPAPLAVTRARRWHSGDLIFESLDFDGEAEDAARLRLERLEGLGDLKGVPATLRTAFGVATLLEAARRANVPMSFREALPRASDAAERGGAACAEHIARIVRERQEAEQRALREAIAAQDRARVQEILARMPEARQRASSGEPPTMRNAAARAEEALESADARMMASRRLEGTHLQVTFEFMGERFITVVDGITLNVLDAGVCLAGSDRLVTLDSLPGVIREAIDTDRLVITRR